MVARRAMLQYLEVRSQMLDCSSQHPDQDLSMPDEAGLAVDLIRHRAAPMLARALEVSTAGSATAGVEDIAGIVDVGIERKMKTGIVDVRKEEWG